MTMHKLTAGDGYQYLIRQVAAVDSTSRGKAPLIDYYSSKGESPGHWVGSGLASLESTGARWVPPAMSPTCGRWRPVPRSARHK